ncbi:MAG: AMP-binding protein, partial [bacterium]
MKPQRSAACVHELFALRARQAPHASAAAFPDGERLTYGELDALSGRLAAALRALGVGPEVLVGLCLDRSPELPTALLGILRAGGAYLPLDPALPPRRLAAILADARPALILARDATAERVLHHGAPVVRLNAADPGDAWLSREAPGSPPVTPVHPQQSAYVLYTSGSTGVPKGVIVPHGALSAHCLAVADAFALDAADRVLQFSSLAFDVAAEELFPTWARGGTVVFRREGRQGSIAELVRFLGEHEITVANLPAAVWHQWADELADGGEELLPPSSLRLLVTGSEAVSPARLAVWRSRVRNGVRWLNAYGPTEATVTATLLEP